MSAPSNPDWLDRFNDWLKPKTKRDHNQVEQGLDLSGRADAPFSLAANPAELPPDRSDLRELQWRAARAGRLRGTTG